MNNENKCLRTAFQECSPLMVRNVCIIAHVDHGKTTLADFLVSTNGIISARLAGKLRYMDSREDEQTRGITMKSSAITLYYEPLLLNLIDSPGHVDFCTEVSSAVNLADIALLLVDTVEGVCSQTESLIRQALTKKLDIILVLNKLDRLIVELKMSVSEAHRHLQRLIEFVNACISKTIQGQLLDEDWHTFDQIESQLHFDPLNGNVLFASALYGYAFTLKEFGQLWAKRLTARDAWEQQPAMKEGKQKKSIDEEINTFKAKLMPHLFSRDHYFVQKSGEICNGAEQKGKKTLFEQFVLEPIWEVHKCALIERDMVRFQQLASKLAIPPLKAKRADEAFTELMRNWLPLSSTVVQACAQCRSAQRAYQGEDGRLRELFIPTADILGLPNGATQTVNNQSRQLPPLPSIATTIYECNPANSKLILAFVAKSFKGVDQRQQQRRISLCRVMSGTIQIEDNLYVLLKSPIPNSVHGNCQSTSNKCFDDYNESENGIIKRDNAKNEENWLPIRVSALFMLLGRELIPVKKVPCGRICGIEVNNGEWIAGPLLSSHPLSEEETPRLDASRQQKFAEPLVRVIIRPSNPGPNEFYDLRSALRQLAVLDSAVRILEPKENELVLLTAGEVHLQKCLEDLNALGQTELVVSEPIVPFLETIVPDPRIPIARIQTEHLTECHLRQFSLRIRIRAVPLAGIEGDTKKLLELLQRNGQFIDSFREGILNSQHRAQIDSFRKELVECSKECLPRLKGSWWAKRSKAEIERLFADGILAFGPAKAKFNILFNNNAIGRMNSIDDDELERNCTSVWNSNLRPLEQAMVGAFHSAMALGPLCDEPMQSVGIVLEEWILEKGPNSKEINKEIDEKMGAPENGEIGEEDEMDLTKQNEALGEDDEKEKQDQRLHSNARLHGQLISAFRQTCRAALKKHSGALRLLAAMYQCRVQTPEQALGKVQAVLAQKRAKVHSEEVNELSGLFEIGAYLPVVESFSFCEQLRKRSSGTASAQLEFIGWQLIDEDPYWEPSTEEEMEEFGGGGVIQQNQARQYMDAVRRRKGLPTEDVIVVFAEKQRNLKRNK